MGGMPGTGPRASASTGWPFFDVDVKNGHDGRRSLQDSARRARPEPAARPVGDHLVGRGASAVPATGRVHPPQPGGHPTRCRHRAPAAGMSPPGRAGSRSARWPGRGAAGRPVYLTYTWHGCPCAAPVMPDALAEAIAAMPGTGNGNGGNGAGTGTGGGCRPPRSCSSMACRPGTGTTTACPGWRPGCAPKAAAKRRRMRSGGRSPTGRRTRPGRRSPLPTSAGTGRRRA